MYRRHLLQAAGCAVKVRPVNDLSITRKRLGLPERFANCHTAMIEGQEAVGLWVGPAPKSNDCSLPDQRALGLAVPGMPATAPGMDVPGKKDPYQVLLLSSNGQSIVYASYPK